MQNPFPISNEKLKKLLGSYKNWLEKKDEVVERHKIKVENRRNLINKILDLEYIESIKKL